MKSLTTISSELAIPIATVRYRISGYSDFIPFTTTNKGKMYSPEAEEVIKLINDCYAQEKSSEEIMQLLSSQYARDITILPEQQPTETIQQQPNEQVERLNNNLEMLIARIDRQHFMQAELNEIKIKMAVLEQKERDRIWWKFL